MLRESEKILWQLQQLQDQTNQVDSVYRSYLRAIARSFKVGRVSLMLIDEARRELFVHEAEGLGSDLKKAARVRIGEGISGWVAEKGEGVLVRDIDRSQKFRKQKKKKGFRRKSFISIPLKVRGTVYGVLNVSERKDGKLFAKKQLNDLQRFGMLLAVLVENQRLRNHIQWLRKKPMDEIASVSHDFRIPLTCVLEVINQIQDEDLGPITTKQRNFLAMAKRNVNRMIQTFDRLLEIATKITTGLEIRRINCNDLMAELKKDFDARAKIKGVKIGLETSRDDEEAWVETDREKIHDVMMNLVDNAVKYTYRDTVIMLRVIADRHQVCLEVEDEGPGMDKKTQVALFDKAASIQRSQMKDRPGEEGHGLGLAICHDVMERLGGKIGVRSCPGKGATFFVKLPKELERGPQRLLA